MGNSTSCRFVLASGSPRRKEMVEWLDIPFSIKTIPIEEVSSCEHPREKAMDIAEKKCFALRSWLEDEKLERAVVLGADTMVSKGELCFGKPGNEDEARKTLGILSGTTHAVYTGVFSGLWKRG